MPDDMRRESLPLGQTPALGATHAENVGLPYLGSGSAAGAEALVRIRQAGMVDESNPEERGGGGEVTTHIASNVPPEHRIPPEQLPESLRKRFPKGMPEVRGGADTGQDLLLQMMQAMQSEEALEVTELTARMHGVQLALAYRYGGSTAVGAKLAADHLMQLSGLPEVIKLTRLATLQQIVTTNPVPAQYNGNSVVEINPNMADFIKQQKGEVIQARGKTFLVTASGVNAPPQLVREFRVNDPERGDSFVMAPLLPEKLEKLAQDIQIQQLGTPRVYLPSELEATRRQTSAYFAMLNLQPGLAGSLSTHDMIALRAFKDRIMSGAHDEAPMMQVLGLVSQVHQALAADKIDALANLYTAHLTETRIFHAMRTFGVAVGMQALTVLEGKGAIVQVSGTVSMGDFMDELLSSQDRLERIMQSITDAGPRQAIRGLRSENEKVPGTVAEEGSLIWHVLGDRLGLFDDKGQWKTLRQITCEGYIKYSDEQITKYLRGLGMSQEESFKWDKHDRENNDLPDFAFTKLARYLVLRTNIPDIEVMMPLTKESLGGYPMDENVAGALYPLYLSAREFSRALLLDMMMTPDFQGKAGKQVRKLKRWNYDVWTYWQARTGLNELQKTFPYKDFISEKLVPALIEKVQIEEVPNWKQTLKDEVARRGGAWLEAFDQYDSYTRLAKDVIATVFTNPTLLPSRMPEVEGYVTALALNTNSTTRLQKIEAYRGDLQREFVSKGQMGIDEFERRAGRPATPDRPGRVGEFERFLDYWNGGGPARPEYEADIASGQFQRGFTLERWLKHRITNERYASRSQRPGTLRTKEEMKAAYDTLTEAEKAVLDLITNNGEHAVKFAGTSDKPGIIDSMGISFAQTEGLVGLGELVEKFHWRNFPINFIPPRLVDGTSVGGYITDFVNLTNDTVKLIDGIGERKVQEKVTALPTTSENIDTGQMIGLAEKAADYILSTYHFVTYPHQRERALEALKVLLWSTTPLKQDELVVATMRAIPKGSSEPTHQEMFIPVNLFGPDEQIWLKGNSMRGSKEGGRKGMIFLSDFPARFRVRFGDIRKKVGDTKSGLFQDMVNMAKECRQSLTVVGMERPNYNTIPWRKTLMALARRLRQGSGLTEKDMQEINRFAEEHFDPGHENVSETGVQRIDRGLQDALEIAQTPLDILSSLLGGGK